MLGGVAGLHQQGVELLAVVLELLRKQVVGRGLAFQAGDDVGAQHHQAGRPVAGKAAEGGNFGHGAGFSLKGDVAF